ncbi:YbjN domain-containing protein [Aliiroseovarius sp. CAU 1755]
MKPFLLAAAAFFSAGFATGACADTIKASEPQSVLDYFTAIGAPANLTEDNVGDPLIEIQYYGTKFAVFFYGCREAKNCDSLQMFSGYTADTKITLEALNAWNAEQRYGRVYQAEDGRKLLEYDIYTGNAGVSSDDFDEMFDIWTELVKSFEDALS